MALVQQCKKCIITTSYNATSIFCRYKATSSDGSNGQSIADYYAGRSVFITGGTGFLGKIFIEKLLYSCREIDSVFILIRDKKGQTPAERLRQMLNNPLYNRLKKEEPQSLNKIVPVTGDISIPGLGIKPEDEQTLVDKVSVVFHSAATVKFFEPLSLAMTLNFEGTREVVHLSRRMKKLDSLVYISTAYTQTIYPVLEEKVYPAPAEVDEIYKVIQKYGSDRKKTNKIIGKRPTTYSFTKALSENYVANCTDLPVTILRPSIVGSTVVEPEPGWLDNWYGMTGPGTDIARGLNYYSRGKPTNKIDLIPVDYVSNLTLIVGAKYNKENGVPVYNSASSGCNPVTLKQIYDGFMKENKSFGCYETGPRVTYFNSKFLLEFATFLTLKTPAYFNDLLLRLKGEQPRHLENVKRVLLTRHSMEFFSINNWTFKVDAARKLYYSLSKDDQAEFPCDPVDINWDKYLKDYAIGVTTHLLPKQLEREKAAVTSRKASKAVIR